MQTNRTMVMSSIMVATFLTAIEGTIVSTAMPKIASELHGLEYMNWVFAAYLLVSSVMVPIFGKLSDLFGRKGVFLTGIVLFLAGSTLCGFSQTMEQLIAFRVLQGVGAGAILPVTTTIIADIYPFEQRAKMIGFMGFVWGAAGIIGPLVGGFFVDQVTWHWIFFMNIPFGLISIVMLAVYLKENIQKSKKKIDIAGALTFSAAMLALLYGVQRGSDLGQWTSPSVLLLFAAFVVFIALFVWIESKVSEPLIPLSLFRSRTITVANGISFLVSCVLMGMIVYVPMWVQGVSGYGATASGLILAPMAITWTAGSFLCGKLLLTRSVRFISIVGAVLLTLSALWLTTIQLASSQVYFYLISALIGIGFGITLTLFTVTVQSAVQPTMRGVATASNMFFRNMGQTIGVSLLGSFFNSMIARHLAGHPAGGTVQAEKLNILVNPQTADQLPAAEQTVLREVLVSGLHDIFLVLVVVTIVVLLSTSLVPVKGKSSQAGEQIAS